MSPDQKIAICKKTRVYAQHTLYRVLKDIIGLVGKPSEVEIRDQWLVEMRKHPDLFPEGWYSPPPQGVGILAGSDADGDACRVNFASLREQDKWPRPDIRLDLKNGLLFVYASPFDRNTGIIGDFGLTLYFGDAPKIQTHLRQCLRIVRQVFDFVQVGQTFAEIAAYQKQLITKAGLNNEIVCVTDPAPADDFGHTIPFVMEDPTPNESELLIKGDYDAIKTMISKKRVFGRAGESLTVQSGMAFTIEPRPRVIADPSVPMVYFHTICVLYENGDKELLTGFDDLLQLAGMDYLEDIK